MEKHYRRSNRGYFVTATPEYKSLLKDEAIEEWVSSLRKKAGWRSTVPSFLRTLQKFAYYSDKSPKELVTAPSGTWKTNQQEELVPATPQIALLAQEFLDGLQSQGKRESARQARTCLLSFFRANGLSLKLDNIPKAPKKEEIILRKRQIFAMADYATSLRNRAIILCMYQSGLSITALRNLNYGHIKKQLEKGKVPIRIHITSHINRKIQQVPYCTFLGADARDTLQAYINERKRKIQKMMNQGNTRDFRPLCAASALFASEGRNAPFGERMAISSVWRAIRDAAERAGLQKERFRPANLRRAFEAELKRARIDEETRLYLMGKPMKGIEYTIEKVEQNYLICNFGRSELTKLAIIKEFVQSLGITQIDYEVQAALKENPGMTKEEAMKLIMRRKCALPSRK